MRTLACALAVTGDPLLVDAANANFHLKTGSAAIGAGTDAGVTVDHDGLARPAAPAIGAYEGP